MSQLTNKKKSDQCNANKSKVQSSKIILISKMTPLRLWLLAKKIKQQRSSVD